MGLELTQEQAIELFDSGFWETMTHEERARFQLYETRLCMPFDIFHEAIEKTLGRPVWTHEFAYVDSLRKEMEEGGKPAPSMQEIIELIPEENRIILAIND